MGLFPHGFDPLEVVGWSDPQYFFLSLSGTRFGTTFVNTPRGFDVVLGVKSPKKRFFNHFRPILGLFLDGFDPLGGRRVVGPPKFFSELFRDPIWSNFA